MASDCAQSIRRSLHLGGAYTDRARSTCPNLIRGATPSGVLSQLERPAHDRGIRVRWEVVLHVLPVSSRHAAETYVQWVCLVCCGVGARAWRDVYIYIEASSISRRMVYPLYACSILNDESNRILQCLCRIDAAPPLS